MKLIDRLPELFGDTMPMAAVNIMFDDSLSDDEKLRRTVDLGGLAPLSYACATECVQKLSHGWGEEEEQRAAQEISPIIGHYLQRAVRAASG